MIYQEALEINKSHIYISCIPSNHGGVRSSTVQDNCSIYHNKTRIGKGITDYRINKQKNFTLLMV